MPTPTEAAQFHIFRIKRMKYMPKKKSESKIETFLKSFCSAKESFRSSESIGLRIIIMNVDMTARIEQKRKDLCSISIHTMMCVIISQRKEEQ